MNRNRGGSRFPGAPPVAPLVAAPLVAAPSCEHAIMGPREVFAAVCRAVERQFRDTHIYPLPRPFQRAFPCASAGRRHRRVIFANAVLTRIGRGVYIRPTPDAAPLISGPFGVSRRSLRGQTSRPVWEAIAAPTTGENWCLRVPRSLTSSSEERETWTAESLRDPDPRIGGR